MTKRREDAALAPCSLEGRWRTAATLAGAAARSSARGPSGRAVAHSIEWIEGNGRPEIPRSRRAVPLNPFRPLARVSTVPVEGESAFFCENPRNRRHVFTQPSRPDEPASLARQLCEEPLNAEDARGTARRGPRRAAAPRAPRLAN